MFTSPTSLRRVAARVSLGLAVGAAGLLLSGCHSTKGGIMPYTGGSQVYASTEHMPVSLVMIDTRNGAKIFEIDVPAGKQFAYQIFEGQGDNEVYTPDMMRYMVMDMGQMTGSLRNAMSVPPERSIRVDVYYRDGGEYRPMPAEAQYRTDQLAHRPGWWSPQGGPMPRRNAAAGMYDSDH